MRIHKVSPSVYLQPVNKTAVDIYSSQGFVLPSLGRWRFSLGIKVFLDPEELGVLVGKTSKMDKGIIMIPEVISDEEEVFVTVFNVGDQPSGIEQGELVARIYSLMGSNVEIQISI